MGREREQRTENRGRMEEKREKVQRKKGAGGREQESTMGKEKCRRESEQRMNRWRREEGGIRFRGRREQEGGRRKVRWKKKRRKEGMSEEERVTYSFLVISNFLFIFWERRTFLFFF
jgi:hypothetical protein